MSDEASVGSLRDPAVLQCPFPLYDAVRGVTPVYHDPDMGIALVTRFDDAMQVLRDPETYSNDAYDKLRSGGVAQNERVKNALAKGFPPAKALAQTDGDRHLYHASMLKPFLVPSKIREMEPRIQGYIEDLFSRIREGEPFDWVKDVAEPLAITVMCDFVGITPDKRDIVVRGAEAEARLLGSFAEEEVLVRAADDWVALQRYAADEITARRAAPRDDLISCVANTPPPEGVEPLTMAEAVHIVKVAFVAGNETTRSALSSSALRLIENPELMDQMRRDPNSVSTFIEEVLRTEAPVMMLFRIATKETELSGVKINKGQILAVVFIAANRDPDQFPCPAQFDLERENGRRHLAFGFGTHYCLGAPVARLELRLAIQALLQRFHRLELAPGESLEYTPSFLIRALSHLQVVGRSAASSRR